MVCRQLLDNVMVVSGIPYNVQDGTERQYKLINSYLELALKGDSRKIEAPAETKAGESALKQAQKMRSKEDEKVSFEKTVTDKDLK